MLNPNTNFYHRRIIKDIADVDKRAQQYLSLRLSYINDKCKPFTKKLQQMKLRTKKYADLCEEQRRVIEESKEIQGLNQDIVRLKDLTGFYGGVLDELERMVFKVEEEKEGLRRVRREQKKRLMEVRREMVLPLVQSVVLQPMEKSLPMIVEKHWHHPIHLPKQLYNKQQKQQAKKRFRKKPSLSVKPSEHCSKQEEQNQQKSSTRQQLLVKIQKFNNTDYLFRECFEKKKSIVNKMIGQLQSNLVKNKKVFLKACNILGKEGQKGDNREEELGYEEFRELDADELVSLIVSFPHVTNSLMEVFSKKRKRIAEILIKQSRLKL